MVSILIILQYIIIYKYNNILIKEIPFMPKKKNSRSPHGAGSIFLRSDGRWSAHFQYIDKNGCEKRKYLYGKTQKEVQLKLTKATNAVNEGTYSTHSPMTVSQWLDIWLKDYVAPTKKIHTFHSYSGIVDNHIKPAFGNKKLAKLMPHEIQTFYNKLAESLSPKTIKNIHGVFHSALNTAFKLEYVPKNPVTLTNLPKVIKSEIRPLDSKNIITFMNAIIGDSYEKVYIVDLFTGMRQSEVLGLTWDCINFETNTIFLYRQHQKLKKGLGYEFTSLKNNKTRTLFPPRLVMDTLRDIKALQDEWQIKAREVWSNEENFVFTNEIGDFLKHETVYNHLKKIVCSIGLDHIRFHDLRHSFAVVSLMAGDDTKTLQQALGHHSAAYTMDTYAHATEEMQINSSKRIDTFIKNTL